MNRPATFDSIMANAVDRRPFKVGRASVDPVSRDASWPGGRERLQPQTLKVLITLVSARGEVVTRDELIQLCWDGRIVGDDVINRSISLLRQFAERAGGFEIETVPRSGYRLAESGIAARSAPKRRWIAGALTAAVLAFVVIAGVALRLSGVWSSQSEPVPVVVRSFTASGGGDASDKALAGGISDELIVRLRRLPGLRIATADPPGTAETGAFKDADFVDGSVRTAGDRVRVTARLQKPDGEVLWSQTFDRHLTDLLNVQEQIASSIAGALSVSFDVGADSSQFGGTNNPEAYAAYLQFAAHQMDADQSVPQRFLERAISLDPHYVKALNQLAVSYGLQANHVATTGEARALMAKMDTATAQAIKANPNFWMGYVSRGFFYDNNRQPLLAMQAFSHAASLDRGNDPHLRASLAAELLNDGRIKDAFAMDDSAQLIDPIGRRSSGYSWPFYLAGRFQDAIDSFNELAASDPDSGSNAVPYVIWSYVALGKEDEALRFARAHNTPFDELKTFDDNPALPQKSLADLRRWTAALYGTNGYMHEVSLAVIASMRGHPKLATDFLRLAYERPFGGYVETALWFPAMAAARKTDDFKQIVTEQGLVDAWRKTGQWPDACHPTSATDFTCS